MWSFKLFEVRSVPPFVSLTKFVKMAFAGLKNYDKRKTQAANGRFDRGVHPVYDWRNSRSSSSLLEAESL